MHGGNIWAAARGTGRPAQQWLDFSASINPLGSPAWVRAAVRSSLWATTHYPDPDDHDLVHAAAARHGPAPGSILFGNGAADLIHLLAAVLAPPAGLVLAPTFGRYAAALWQVGARVDELPAWPSPPDPVALDRWLAAAPPESAAFLCHPNNPTGRLLPPALLATALNQDRVWVVVDEAFLDFVPGARSLLPLAGHHPRLVILRSLTKLYAIPGLRLGWLAGPPDLVARLRRRRAPWSVGAPAAAAGLAALTGPDYTAATQAAVVRLRRDQWRMLAPLARHLEPEETDGNFFLVRLRGLSAAQLQDRLLPHGILVRGCSDFSRLGAGYVRLAVRPRREAQRLAAALAAVLS